MSKRESYGSKKGEADKEAEKEAEGDKDKDRNFLASLYSTPYPAKSEEAGKPAEEKAPGGDISDEGKLKLFVGGLYFQSEKDLTDYFGKIAPIVQCTLKKDKSGVKSRGFAFVTLEDKDGSVRKKVFSIKHKIKDKYVDLKLAESDKKRMDQLSSNKKVFVGGLEPTVDANDLKKYFEKFGGVQDAIVLRDVNTNASRGFGFVTFDSEEVADKCVQENNYDIKGKRVDIKKADPKNQNQRQSRTYPIPSQDHYSVRPDDRTSGMCFPMPYPYMPDGVRPPSYLPGMYPPFPYEPQPGADPEAWRPQWPYSFPLIPPDISKDEGNDSKATEAKPKSPAKEDFPGPTKDYPAKRTTYAPY